MLKKYQILSVLKKASKEKQHECREEFKLHSRPEALYKGDTKYIEDVEWAFEQLDQEEKKKEGKMLNINLNPIPPVKTKSTNSAIAQYTTSGVPVAAYETVQEAAETVNGDRTATSGIRQAANGKCNTAYGFQWKWLEEVQ